MVRKIIRHLKNKTLIRTLLRGPLRRHSVALYCLYVKAKAEVSSDMIARPHEIVYVPVNLINHVVEFDNCRVYNYSKLRIVGKISDGDWDNCNKEEFTNLRVYKGFKERFVDGKDWEETIFYSEYPSRRKKISWIEYKEKTLKRYDLLFDEIRVYGYKAHYKTTNYYRSRDSHIKRPESEIEVGVSRDGEILFIDGKHRLSIAKILNIEEVPVIVNHWHKEYIDKVKRVTGEKRLTPSEAIKYALEYNTNYCQEKR